MNTRVLLYAICAILGLFALPPMFGVLPPNHAVGIRLSATLSDPVVWYLVHGVIGWAVFGGAVATSLWLKRHPDAGRVSPFALMLAGMALLAGFMLG